LITTMIKTLETYDLYPGTENHIQAVTKGREVNRIGKTVFYEC